MLMSEECVEAWLWISVFVWSLVMSNLQTNHSIFKIQTVELIPKACVTFLKTEVGDSLDSES